ncbi:MAG: lipocalin-like domain-containing protein, partial [Ilumatobacteraceae bacterium]
QSGAGEAVWRSCGEPFAYDVALVGADSAGELMALRLNVTPTRAPVPLGGPIYHGKIACFGQDDTYSYFQTGMTMTGKLQWGSVAENVSGTAGHVDRQWFPRYAGGGGTDGDPRARAHEWRTIHLDNGVDLSVWRQFDRANHNALQLFSGATTSPPVGEPEFADDIEVDVTSYVRWPEEVRPLVPPLAAARYMPDRHRITSRQVGLDLTGEPLVAAPAHALPIEYMEGPYRYHGTLAGKPVNGSAFYERSLALYRDWELVDVLATVIDVGELRSLIREGRRDEAVEYLADVDVHPLVDDLIAALHRSILELPGS